MTRLAGIASIALLLSAAGCYKADDEVAGADAPGTLQFSLGSYAVGEAGGSATITVTRTGGSLGSVNVAFASSNGSATAGADYAAASGTLFWAAGDAASKTFTVAVTDDASVEGDETVNLTLSLPSGGASLGSPAAAVLTIQDNDVAAPGALQFDSATYSVGEAGGSLTLTVTRTGGSAGAVGVTFATSNGTALAGSDYTAASGTLSWAAGDTAAKTFTVPITNDVLNEGNETFNLALSAPTGGATLGTQSTAVATIVDNDNAGTLQFSGAAYSANESGVVATITVTRTGGAGGAVGVSFAASDGSAVAGSDYVSSTGTLSWADADSAPKTFTVSLINDAVVEPNETVNLTLSAPTGGAALGAPSAAVLTILNDDVSIQLSAAAYSVAESGGSVTITATRAGTTVGAVSVSYATFEATAQAGSDYASASGTLSWPDGDGAPKTFAVTILNDALTEGAETFTVTLLSPTGGATLQTPASASVTIIDNPGSLQFSASATTVAESGVTVSVTVTRTGGSGGAVGVSFATSDGTAASPGDYAGGSGTLSWADGDASPKTISVAIVNDLLVESSETFAVTLSAPTGGATLGATTTATVTITDNDTTLQFSAATYSVNENVPTLTISVTRVGDLSGAVGVNFATSNGTAIAGADYVANSGTLSWAAGDGAPKTFAVTITDDFALEGDETVNLALSAPTGGATVGAPGTAVLTILDDDAPGSLQLSASTYSVNEAAGTVTIAATRTGGVGGTVTISYATSNGTAVAAGDYTAASGTLTWAPGDSAPKTFTVPITNDALSEGSETFSVALSGPTGGATLGTPASATVTIVDNPGTVQLSVASSSIAEGGTATITVTRTGGRGGAASVGFATSNGTATAGTDYTANSGTLTWADGDDASKSFTVATAGDALTEGTETVNLTLSGAAGASLGTPATGTLNITDSAGTIQLSASTGSVNEGAGAFTITATRAAGSGGAVGVSFATADGTAASPGDYTASSGTLAWADGDAAPKTITVPITNDLVIETSETFTVSISLPTGGATLGTPTSATVTIADNDTSLQFSAAAYSVNENVASVTITATRLGDVSAAATVNFATSDGTAAAGADYAANSGTLSWAAGDGAPKTFAVAITDDFALEGDETVNLTLSAPSPGATVGTPGTAVLTILDDDAPGSLQLSASTYGVNESAGPVTITATRTGGVGGTVSVTYATSPGTAGAGSDYTTTSGTLTWTAGDSAPKTFTVPIAPDAISEGSETFTVSLSGPTGGATLGTPASATVTIIDSPGTVQLSAGSFSVAEGGTATITATRTGGRGGAASVAFATSNGTATAGADYTANSGTLNWVDGDDAPKSFTVVTAGDALLEGTETVNLTLSGPTGATLGAPPTGTLNILDSPGTLQFSSATYAVSEAAGLVTITVTRAGGSGGAASVNYATANGTALAGLDYTLTSGTLSWADNDGASKTFSVPIASDGSIESSETFTVALSLASGAALGTPFSATVTITDHPGTVQLSAASYTVAETGTSITVTVTRTGGSGGAASVNFATADGTATQPADYTLTSGTLNWADGDTAPKTFSVPIIVDSLTEGSEGFSVTLSGAVGAALGAPASATVTITDSPGSVQLSASTYTVNEGAGTVTITATRTGGSGGAASVGFATADGSATQPADYTLASGTLSWADNDAASKTFSVTIAPDTLAEGSENFTVTLSGATGAALGVPASATVTIIDSPGSLQFSAATYSGTESSAVVSITATRTGGRGGAVSVNFATSNGTALAPGDYTAASGTLNWADGDDATKSFSVTLANDSVPEPGGETFGVALTGPGGGATLGTPNTATVTIIDNPGVLQFSAATYTAAENVVNAVITVTRTSGSGGAATATFATSDGTALAGSDYGATSGTLTWVDGEMASKSFAVPITNDTAVEPSETVNLALTGSTGAALGAQASAVLTITDNDVSLQFSAAAYTVSETGTSATITLTRAGTSVGAVGVTFSTVAGGTAAAGSDYTGTTTTVAWADGDIASKTVSVPVATDTTVEGTETVNLALSLPTGGATLGAPDTAVLSITDSPGSIQWSSPTFSVGEAGPTVNLTATRTAGNGGAVGVTVAMGGGGSAVNGVDFTLPAMTLSWADGDTASKSITVTILEDTQAEGNENRDFVLVLPTGGAVVGAPALTVMTIMDNDVELRFRSFSYAVDEAGPSIVIDVMRVGGSVGAVGVNFAVGGGTATAGLDYTSPASGTLSWADGDTADKTFTIAILEDTLPEGDETVNLSLNTPTPPAAGSAGSSLGTPNAVALTIQDNDRSVQFSAATYSVNENGASATITVTRTGATSGAVAVNFGDAGGGTATAGADYSVTPGTLNWAAGDTAPKTFPVTVANDTVVEADETLNLGLSGVVGASIGSPGVATLTIVNDDTALRFSAASYSVNENQGSIVINVQRIGVTTGAVSVQFATSNGTALAPSDYASNSGTLNWGAGDGADKPFTVTVVNDASIEPTETVNLALSAPGGGATIDSPGVATLNIVDNPGTLQFSGSTYSFDEGVGTAFITVTRITGSGGAASVNFATSDGTALQPGDYSATSGTLSWAAGDTTPQIFSVAVVNDVTPESDETVNIALTLATGATLGVPSTAVLTILDNDGPGRVQFSPGTYSVNENGGPITLTVTRTNGSVGLVSVDFATSNVTATAGADYTFTGGTLSWASGDTAPKTIVVPITDDANVEGPPNETFNVVLSNPLGGVTLGTPSTAPVTILENDIGFAFSGVTDVNENGGSYTVSVLRNGSTVGTASVLFATSNGTATAGADYAANSGTLSWADGDTAPKPITVTINEDSLAEGNETFNITLSSPSPPGATVTGPNPWGVTILDNDTSFQFSSATFSVGEGAGPAVITVTRTGATGGTNAVNFATSDGSAAAPGDYTAAGGTLTFGPGVTSLTFPVTIINDSLVEGTETVNLALSAPTGGAFLSPPSTAVLSIVDNDASVQFSSSVYSVSESGPTVTISVTRVGSSSGAISVNWATANGTAVSPGDYVGASGTLSWADGDMVSKTFAVTIVDDGLNDPGETFTVGLSGVTGAILGTPSTATVTILDNDVLTVFWTTPRSGPVGAVVVIGGTGFGPLPADNTVQFNGVTATVSQVTGTGLVVTVPVGATTGPVTVQVGASTVTNPQPFTVLAPVTGFNTTLSVSKALSAARNTLPFVLGPSDKVNSGVGALAFSNVPSLDRYVVGTGETINIYDAANNSLLSSLDHTTTNDELLSDITLMPDGTRGYAAVFGPAPAGLPATGALGRTVQIFFTTPPSLGGRIDLTIQDPSVRAPDRMALTPDGRRLLVVTRGTNPPTAGNGHLVVIDTFSNAVTNTFTLAPPAGRTTDGHGIAIHPSGSHAYCIVNTYDAGGAFVDSRLQVFSLSTLAFIPASELVLSTEQDRREIVFRPSGSSGFFTRSGPGGAPGFLQVMDFSNPAVPALGASFDTGNLSIQMAISPDGNMLYALGTVSGEQGPNREANVLVRGFDISGPTPTLFDEAYLGSGWDGAIPWPGIFWHYLGNRFLGGVSGFRHSASQLSQDGLVHDLRVFAAGAEMDLLPYKGGPSGPPLSGSTLTVFTYDGDTGMPAPGVNVSLSSNAGAVLTSGTTNANGIATFAGLTGPQNITVAPVGKINLTIMGVNAQNGKFPLFDDGSMLRPNIIVVVNGIPPSPGYASVDLSTDGGGGNFLTTTNNVDFKSMPSNERFTLASRDNNPGSGARHRHSFARPLPGIRLYYELTLVAETDTKTISGNVVMPSDLPNGFTGGNVPMAADLIYSAEQGNQGVALNHFGFTPTVNAATYSYSNTYLAPIAGVGNIRLKAGISQQGFPSGGMTPGPGADPRVLQQQAEYDSWIPLGANPATPLTGQNFTYLNAPFLETIAGTAYSQGMFLTDSTPTVVFRNTIGPASTAGMFLLFMQQSRPGGIPKGWGILIGSADAARVTPTQVTVTVPDLPAAVASESFASSNNRVVFMEVEADDLGPAFNLNSWQLGNTSGGVFGDALLRGSFVNGGFMLGTPKGTVVTGPSMMAGRYNHGTVALANGTVLSAGGHVNPNPNLTNTGEIYFPVTNTVDWTRSGPTQTTMSVVRNEVPAVRMADNRVIFLGGSTSAGNSVTADIYDPATGAWSLSTTPNMGVGRIGHAAVLLNDGRVLVAGGLTGTMPSETVVPEIDIYSPSTNNFSTFNSGGGANQLVARDGIVLTVLNPGGGFPTNVLVTGGRRPASGFQFSSSVPDATACVISVPNGGAPTIGSSISMTSARIGHAAIRVASGDVLLFGGAIEGFGDFVFNLTASVERYNAGTGTFSAMPGLLLRRAAMGAALTTQGGVPKVILVAGREEPSEGGMQNSDFYELYDVATGATDAVGFGVSRESPRTVVVPRPGFPSLDRIVTVGGRDNDTAFNTIELYDPN